MTQNTPVAAIRSFIEANFVEYLDDVYFHVLSAAATDEEIAEAMGFGIDAFRSLFEVHYADEGQHHFASVRRALLLRSALDFYIWSLTDADQAAWAEGILQRGAAQGLEDAEAHRQSRQGREREAASAALGWKTLIQGDASFAAIKRYALHIEYGVPVARPA